MRTQTQATPTLKEDVAWVLGTLLALALCVVFAPVACIASVVKKLR